MVNFHALIVKIINWISSPIINHAETNSYRNFRVKRDDTNIHMFFGVGQGGINHGIYSWSTGGTEKWLIHGTDSQVFVNQSCPMDREVFTSGIFTRNTTNTSSADTVRIIRWGKIAQLHITWTNKVEISVATTGNITDITVGTIADGYRPRVVTTAISNGNARPGSNWYNINTEGVVTLTALEGTGTARTVATGSTFYCKAIYICQ